MKNSNNFAKKMVNTRKTKASGSLRQKDFDGPKETVEEFLARGGKITVLPPRLAPDIEAGDPPRLPYTGWGMYS